ncbi:hypothetical protein QJQ45_004547 [Haematococcus lacustris]|nr:hypothetical protein QJQ45_004547 [Haematococcus lacustris]
MASGSPTITPQRDADNSQHCLDFASLTACDQAPPPHLLTTLPSQEATRVHDTTQGPITDIQQLVFYSWWSEDCESADLGLRISCDSIVGGGIKKRYATVTYDLASKSFSLLSSQDGQDVVLGPVAHVTNRAGGASCRPVDVWDLHVGAKLGMLGRTVCLMKSELRTAQWIEHHAQRLLRLKAKTQAELQKYKPRAHKACVSHDKGQGPLGGLCLSHTVKQLHVLLDDVAQYRPSVATQLREQISILLTDPQPPRSSQEATQPAASAPGPSTPLPAKRTKRTKRTKAEPKAAEPTQPTEAAIAKPAPFVTRI